MTETPSIEEQISAYLDGEMSAEDRAAFEERLESDPHLLERVGNWQQTDDLLQSLVPEPSDSHMDRLMVANLPHEPRWPLRKVASWALIFVMGAVGGFGLNEWRQSQNPAQVLIVQATMDATSAHRIFTAEARHAVEVGPDEAEHLETWLTKRMGREMAVPQLEGLGLTFVGGRLLPSGGKAAAQYMYENAEGERVTVYMARTDAEARSALRFLSDDGLTTVRWQDGPWVFFVVGPMDKEAISPIVDVVHDTLI